MMTGWALVMIVTNNWDVIGDVFRAWVMREFHFMMWAMMFEFGY